MSRTEEYYRYLATGQGSIPKPLTREEQYLYTMCTELDPEKLAFAKSYSEQIEALVDAADALVDEAESVRDSIPEDYSTLSSDVTELKVELSILDNQIKKYSEIDNNLEWEKGILSNSDGSAKASSIAIRTKYYYAISPDSKVTFNGVTENLVYYGYFYDVNKTFILRSSTFTIPQNAVYVKFAYSFTTESGITVDSYGGVSAVAAGWSTTYTSGAYKEANDIVNAKASELVSDTYTYTGNKRFTDWINGKYLDTSGSTVDVTAFTNSSSWRCAIIPCSAGDTFTVTISGGSTPRAYCFTDSSYNVLYKHSGSSLLENYAITAPSTTAYLILNDTYRLGNCYYGKYIKQDVIDRIDSVTTDGNLLPTLTSAVTSNGVTYTPITNGYSCTGTASATSYCRLYNQQIELPAGMYAGETYYLDYETPNLGIKVQVLKYVSGTSTKFAEFDHSGTFTIPSDADGLCIRLYTGNGVKTDCIVSPKIYAVKSLAYARLHRAKNTSPMLSIIYDDGFKEFDTYIMPIIRQKKVPIATAVISESVAGYSYMMTWAEIQACYADGAEVLPHFGAYTDEEWETFGTQDVSWRYYKTLNAIRAHGIYTPPVLVFSGSSSQRTICRMAAMRIFKAGLNAAGGNINQYGAIDPYYIDRYNADKKTENDLKGLVDDLITAQNGWMIWTRHNGSSVLLDGQTAQDAADALAGAIDYAIAQGVQIVTVERGLAEYLDI